MPFREPGKVRAGMDKKPNMVLELMIRYGRVIRVRPLSRSRGILGIPMVGIQLPLPKGGWLRKQPGGYNTPQICESRWYRVKFNALGSSKGVFSYFRRKENEQR
jgi:hypothetical protein